MALSSSAYPFPWNLPFVDTSNGILTPTAVRALQQARLLTDGIAGRTLTAGAGLTGGGTLQEDRTFAVGAGTGITVGADAVAIANTAVSPGSYGASPSIPTFTVDQQGRLTAAGNRAAVPTSTVAALPVSGTVGETIFATDCRVFNGAGAQEGAGVGTGGLVSWNGTAWKIAGTNVTAVA